MKRYGLGVVFGLMMLTAAAAGKEEAKDLYYERDERPSQGAAAVQQEAPRRVGLKYKIVLMDSDGDVREVTERHRFSSGDRIRLVFESNIDGYLYIFHKGASSKGVQLFPDSRINEGRNEIRRFTHVTIPPRAGDSRGWWRFDRKTGTEELIVMLSPKPIPSLAPQAPAAQGTPVAGSPWQMVTALRGQGEKSGKPVLITFSCESVNSEAETSEPTAAYVVEPEPAMLIHTIRLSHGE